MIHASHFHLVITSHRSKWLYHLFAGFIFFLTIILMFYPYSITLPLKYLHLVSSDTPQFLIQSDYLLQYVPFYEEFFRLVDAGKIAWSVNEMFGINFFASKAYYCVGDPFAWLMVILRLFMSNTIDLLFFITIIKLIVAGFTFRYLLSKLHVMPLIGMIYSCLYICSGWMTIFIEQPVFISFYAFAPLLIASIIDTIQQQHPPLLLPIALALCIITQYYLAWMLCVLILIGWIVYHCCNHTSFQTFVRLSLNTLLYSLIGVGIAAIIWLPSIFHMIQNPRLDGNELNTYWFYDWKDILNLIKNAYLPVLKYSDHAYRNYWYYFYQTGLYCGVFNILIFPLFFINPTIDSKTKRWIGITTVLLLITLISPQCSKLFHFTYSLRYTYGFMILLLICGSITFKHIDSLEIKPIIINSLLQFILVLTIAIIWPLIQGCTINTPDVKLGIICAILIPIYTLILIAIQRTSIKKLAKLTNTLLLGLLLAEAIFYGNYAIKGQTENANAYAPYLSKVETYKSAIAKLRELDNSVYRVQLVNSELNDGLVYGIPSTTAYDSTYQYALHDFLQWIRQYPDVSWSFNVDLPDLDPLLNVRYIILDNPTPEQVGYYKYWAQVVPIDSELTILKMNNPTAFAKTITEVTTDELVIPYQNETLPLNTLLVDLQRKIIVDEEDYNTLKHLTVAEEHLYNPTTFSDNAWTIQMSPASKDYLLFVAQAVDNGWKFTDQNGMSLDCYKVHGGFTAIKVNQETTVINAVYSEPGINAGLIVSIFSIVVLLMRKIYLLKTS